VSVADPAAAIAESADSSHPPWGVFATPALMAWDGSTKAYGAPSVKSIQVPASAFCFTPGFE
jgi:hypothetical protein